MYCNDEEVRTTTEVFLGWMESDMSGVTAKVTQPFGYSFIAVYKIHRVDD